MTTAARELLGSRDLFVTLVERQLRLRAKRAWMGTVWPVVAPGFLLLLYMFVFNSVFDVPIDRYPEYLLCGLLPWAFLAHTMGKSVASLSTEPEIIRKAPFPYELLPISTVAANGINLVIGTGIFVVYLAAVGRLEWALLAVLVVPVVAVILLVMALSTVVALIDVYNHDFRQVQANLLTIWFFLIPVVYRSEMAPDLVERWQRIDPMSMIIADFRSVLYDGRIDDPLHVVITFLTSAALFIGALVLFRRFAGELPKDV